MKNAAFSKEKAWAGAVFAASLLLYLSVRSRFFNFDGVACAIAVDLSDFKHLVHGNHLAYGIVGWAFHALWRLLGYAGPSLYPLQVLDGLLGAAGAAAFCSLLIRLGRAPREAALTAAALAVSHAWWFWSLEAQVYMLGALFAALAAREALAEKPRPALVGLFHAGAVLGHAGHLMALPALAWALGSRRRAELKPYAAALAATLALAYAAAGLLAVRPANPAELKLWLLGSAALGVERGFAWHGTPLAKGLFDWSRMSLRVFAEFVGRSGAAWALGVLLAALPLAAAASGARTLSREARFWLLWLAGYAALFLFWEPYTIVYRVTDLLPLWALASLGLARLKAPARAAALAAWTACALAYNLAFVVRPAADPAGNPDLADAEWVKEAAPKDAWVLTNGRGAVYIPYFAGRRPINLRYYDDEAALLARLDAHARAGETVVVSGRALEQKNLRERLERYGLSPLAERDGLGLYWVKPKARR